jgi:hypothetical protein
MSGDLSIITSEMTEFQKELLKEANELFPKDYKNFLKKQGSELVKTERKIAQREVGEDNRNGYRTVTRKRKNGTTYNKKVYTDYHKGFKRGKMFEKDGASCIRGYNGTKHAHLIEYGHNIVARGEGRSKGFGRRNGAGGAVIGRAKPHYVLKQAEYEFTEPFTINAEKFLDEHFTEFKGTHI